MVIIMVVMMMCAACAINQSSDSQDLGRYLGFRLRCLDVDSSTSRPTAPPAAATTTSPLFDAAGRLPECPYDVVGGRTSPLQSPLVGTVPRGPSGVDVVGESPRSQRRVMSLPRSVKNDNQDDVSSCNIIANSRTAELHVNN